MTTGSKRFLPVILFAAAYTILGLWLFGTKPAIPDHAVIVGGLITYIGLSVIFLSVVWRVARRVFRRA